MRIALIQQHATKDKAENVQRGLAAAHAAADRGAKLICFAELSFEWFHPQRPASDNVASLAETVPGPTTNAFAALARESETVIVFNLLERAGDKTYDTSPVIDADGTLLGATRMVHITDYPCFHERGFYALGDRGAPVYDTAAGRVGVAICYDRHFPEYMRALALNGADLVVVPQAGAVGEWPEGLFEAEMRVAAFQNGYFVALCNRVGKEDCLTFAGASYVCHPDGSLLAQAPAGLDHILVVDLAFENVKCCHARRLFLPDRRPELYAAWFATR